MNRNHEIVKKIFNKIDEHSFNDINKLIVFLDEFLKEVDLNPQLKKQLQLDGVLSVTDYEQKDFRNEILKYYREKFPIDLVTDDVTTFKAHNDQDVVQYKDAEGDYHFLQDNTNDTVVKQMKDIQEAREEFQTGTPEENTNKILEEMNKRDKEYNAESVETVNIDRLTEKEQLNLTDIKNSDILKDKHIKRIEELDEFVDTDTGEIYYIDKDNDGNKFIKKRGGEKVMVDETTQVTDTNITSNENEYFANINTKNVSNLSLEELEYLVNHPDMVSQDVLKDVTERYNVERKVEEAKTQTNDLEPKVLVLTKNNNVWTSEHTGFTSFVTLVLILGLYAVGILSCLFWTIK